MPITTFLDPTLLPARTMDEASFNAAMAYLMTNLPTWGAQANATAASMNTAASGNANKIPYKIDLGTTMADPTAGWLRFNSATQNAATSMVVDVIGSDNIDYTSLLYTFDDSTSLVLGEIRVEKQGDASKFLVFNLTAMSTPSGYRQFTVSCVGYSTASPFAQADPIVLSFTRSGDKGDMGSFPTLHLREERASGTASTAPTNLSANLYRRPLNVAKVNTITGASLGTDQFVLPAGTYRVRGDSLSLVLTGSTGAKYWHKMALYSVTDSAYLTIGLNGLSYDPTNTQNYVQMSPPVLTGSITLAAAKTIELRHLTPNANMASVPAASSGQVEVYTDLIIEKTS